MRNDAAPSSDAWDELRAVADALQDQLIVLPDAEDPGAGPATGGDLDAWDELRAIAGASGPDGAPPPR